SFRAIELPNYSAGTGLAFRDSGLLLGGYEGKQVENATALSSLLDPATEARSELGLPRSVQLTSPVCTPEVCLGVTPTGSGDVIVRLPAASTRWQAMSAENTAAPLAFERVFLGPLVAYAFGPASPLMRAQP